MATAGALITFVVASLARGYQQRQIARNWQKLALGVSEVSAAPRRDSTGGGS